MKKETHHKEVSISYHDLTGTLKEIREFIDSLEARGVTSIYSDSYGYDGGVDFYAQRLETDEEEVAREAKEAEENRVRAEKAKATREANKKKELAQLAKLKAKYEAEGSDGA